MNPRDRIIFHQIHFTNPLNFFLLVSDLSVWNKSLSQRWRRIRRRCSSFTTTSTTNVESPDSQLQKQYLLETSGSSLDSPKVICSDSSPLAKSIDTPDQAKSTDEDSAAANALPDVSHMLRLKFNKFQNGFRKRRALSVHESLSEKDRNNATFYVPTPLSRSSDDVEHGDELEAASLPPSSVLNRIPCARLNYKKSPSECSSGRGTVTPTEEFDNDSSGSNQSCKSTYYRKYSYDDKVKETNDKNGYWDQGYHSIEYSPVADNIYRYNSPYSCKSRYDERVFKDTSNLPTTRLSSKSENVPTSKFVNSPSRQNAKLPTYDSYRTPDRRNRASVSYERTSSTPDCISINVKLSGNECTTFAPRRIVNDPRFVNESRSRTPSSCERRRLMNLNDPLVEDDFDERLILRNEPKSRSCRRWSQADSLAIESAAIAKPCPQNGFRIGDRVTVDMYVGCQLPYAALQSIEPMSMPYLSPPIPSPRNDKQYNKVPNLRRRSARSVSPESRKKETEARDKRQQIVQNLQKYVDQRRKSIVGACKSNADLTSVSENDSWKKEDNSDKVINDLYAERF